MERRPFISELDPQINSLEKRRDNVAYFTQNIGTPGWIESQWAEGIRKGGQKLALLGLPDEERFARLASTIIPLQIRLIGEVLPSFDEKIDKIRQRREASRVQAIRDRFILDPLYPPLRNYSGVVNTPEVAAFLRKANPPSRNLLSAFLSGSGASRVLNSLVRFSDTATIKSDDFNSYLAGAIFEEVGYLYAASLSRKGDITILSPEETSFLYRNIHMERKFDAGTTYGFNFMIDGITVPDGLVISNKETSLDIVLIAEYKSIGQNNYGISYMKAQRESYTPEQLEAHLRLRNHQSLDPFDVGRLLHAIRPALPEKPVRVSPDLLPLYIIPKGTNIRLHGILIDEVPITTGSVHAFAETLKKVKLLQRST